MPASQEEIYHQVADPPRRDTKAPRKAKEKAGFEQEVTEATEIGCANLCCLRYLLLKIAFVFSWCPAAADLRLGGKKMLSSGPTFRIRCTEPSARSHGEANLLHNSP
jgi:hypothetical protein